MPSRPAFCLLLNLNVVVFIFPKSSSSLVQTICAVSSGGSPLSLSQDPCTAIFLVRTGCWITMEPREGLERLASDLLFYERQGDLCPKIIEQI